MTDSESIEWRWVDLDGSQSVVRRDQLIEALATGSLPDFTLVWRAGWTDWLSASRVPDLAVAFPGVNSGPLTAVRITPHANMPPAAPLERYQQLVPGAQKTLLRPKRLGAPATMPPPPPPPRPGHARPLQPPPPRAHITPPPKPIFSPAPIPVRDVQPTLAEMEPVRSPTLRPVGGMPPPPRTVPRQMAPFIGLEENEDGPPSLPDGPDPAELDAETEPPIAEMPPVAPVFERRMPPQELVVTQPSAHVDPSSPAPVVNEAEDALPRRGQSFTLGGASHQTVTRATAIGVLLPGTLLLLAFFVKFYLFSKPSVVASGAARPAAAAQAPTEPVAARAPSAEPVAPVAPAAAAPAAPAPAAATGCTLEKAATRLAESAFVGVPVVVTKTKDGHVAVGFAAAKDRAVGLDVDLESLTASQVFQQPVHGAAALGVVPLAHGKATAFAVDRAEPRFAFARTVDAAKPFVLGVTAAGFSRVSGRTVDVIWPGHSPNPTITTPRVASVPGLGHAIAFRHGGQEGKVLVGWLSEKGEKQSDLKAVGTDAALVGTPAISASDAGVLLSFASKTAPEAGFRVELASAARGALPEKATPFTLPPGGPGGEAISPSSEALGGDRYVLQWTEGSAGNRAVRVQALSVNLDPLGEPVTLSTPEQNAGQGVLSVQGDRVLALYLVKKESSHELWGASLRCP